MLLHPACIKDPLPSCGFITCEQTLSTRKPYLRIAQHSLFVPFKICITEGNVGLCPGSWFTVTFQRNIQLTRAIYKPCQNQKKAIFLACSFYKGPSIIREITPLFAISTSRTLDTAFSSLKLIWSQIFLMWLADVSENKTSSLKRNYYPPRQKEMQLHLVIQALLHAPSWIQKSL